MSKYIATLETSASAGHLQVVAGEHHGYQVGVSQGGWSSYSTRTDSRYGSVEMRATRDALRRSGEQARILVSK